MADGSVAGTAAVTPSAEADGTKDDDARIWLARTAPPGGWPSRASETCEPAGVLTLMNVLKPPWKRPVMDEALRRKHEELGIVEKVEARPAQVLKTLNLRRNHIDHSTQNRLEMRFGEAVVRLLEPKPK